MEPEQIQHLLSQADELYTQGRLEEALDLYSEVVSHDQTMAWPYSRIGAIFAQTGEPEHAEEAFNRALEIDPALPQAHSNLGNLLYARGEYELALQKYKEALALDPNNPIFHENIHAAYKKLRRFTEAVSALKQAHRLNREGTKAEAKEKMERVKRNVKGRMGCFTLVLLPFVVGLAAVLF